MDLPGYVALTRLAGLDREMSSIANNIANASTTGFRREGLSFTEAVRRMPSGEPSVSLSGAGSGFTDVLAGEIRTTGQQLDLAIAGDGFFAVEAGEDVFLTRAGNFTKTPDGEMALPNGAVLLNDGGAPVVLPPIAADISVGPDGTISADGAPLDRVGLFTNADPLGAARRDGVMFRTEEPAPDRVSQIMQGALEASNVSPVSEMARMIEVQRAYEQGMRFLDTEDDRIRNAVRTLGERR